MRSPAAPTERPVPSAGSTPRGVGEPTAAELRLRLFTVPATLAHSGRRRLLHLADHHPWASVVTDALTRLRDLTAGPTPAPG